MCWGLDTSKDVVSDFCRTDKHGGIMCFFVFLDAIFFKLASLNQISFGETLENFAKNLQNGETLSKTSTQKSSLCQAGC